MLELMLTYMHAVYTQDKIFKVGSTYRKGKEFEIEWEIVKGMHK
jgi:hypothetical protein